MLNKEICRKCWLEQFSQTIWDKQDDMNWNDGWTWCSVVLVHHRIEIEDGAPKECRYFVEQFLYHDATKKKKTHAK